MTWRAGTVGFLLLAAAAGAEEPVAPLAKSAQELKALQRDQTTRNNETAGGKLSGSLPQMSGPTPGAPGLEQPKPPKSEADLKELKKKKDAQKNWLVDGVEQLEKNPAAKGRGAREPKETGIAGEEKEKLDSSDPDYILKLYTEQQKEAEAKAAARQPVANPPDPFAPFLQGWLGTSPARGKFFDESLRKPDSSLGSVAPAGSPGAGTSPVFSPVDVPGSPRGTVAETPPNPYLQGLDLPSLPDSGASHNPGTLNLGTMTKSTDSAPAALPGGTQPAMRPTEKKPLPPVPAEDKKYFPQLKRF